LTLKLPSRVLGFENIWHALLAKSIHAILEESFEVTCSALPKYLSTGRNCVVSTNEHGMLLTSIFCKKIKTDWRASLHPTTLSQLMRISIEGQDCRNYDPNPAVNIFWEIGQRARGPNQMN